MNVPYIIDRLKELSTWRMFAAIGAAFGTVLTAGQVQVAFAAFTALVALYEAFQPQAPSA